jgi:hypothetical protein
MQKESPTKVTEKILTTKNPYLRGAPTRWPMPEQLLFRLTEAFPEMLTEVSETNSAPENVKQNTNESYF